MRRRSGFGLVAAAAFVAGGAASRQGDRAWRDLDGREWVGFTPREKQAYVAGFLTGAGLAEAEAATRGAADSTRLHAALDSLARAGALRFAYGAMVYANQLDEFYWWANHVPVRLYLALNQINERMRGGGEQQ